MHQQPSWMCNKADCRFRNRLRADARLTIPHSCPQPVPIPVFINPFPPPKPITMLPPPPLAPAPPGSFYFPPPNFPPPAPPAIFPIPGPPVPILPPAPMPPGPFMLPPPQAPPVALRAPQALPPQNAEQNSSPPESPDPEKSPSIGNVVHEKNVHIFKPKKGPISKEHKDALSDFEERTRRQDYRDLAASSKSSQHKSETSPAKKPASAPRSILKQRPAPAPTAVNQEVHVNVYNTGLGSKNKQKSDGADSSQSAKSIPAKDAATVRKEAIKRAHSLAHGIAAAAAPAAMMSGALKPPSVADLHPASGPPSHASKEGTPKPTPSNAPSKHSSHPSTAGTQAHKSKSSRARSHNQSPLAIATATAKAQANPPSIESWRKGVKRPTGGA
jgi:hypothetical protein